MRKTLFYPYVRINKSWCKQRGVNPHFSTEQNLLRKYWENINGDTINKEKLFPPGKIYWTKNWDKINIGTITREKLSPPGKIY